MKDHKTRQVGEGYKLSTITILNKSRKSGTGMTGV
jgi:hypothetical protein